MRSALSVAGNPVPCAAWSYAVATSGGGITILNSQSIVDSYNSRAGAYGGTNVGTNAVVQSATSIVNNGAVIRGTQRQNASLGLSVVPVPTGAINLPIGSSTPGSLNINSSSQSITLAPGNYVAANVTVNAPGKVSVSPAGPVRIWVTGTLNLGGSENPGGSPSNLAFLVTSSNWVNVNTGGALYGMIYAPAAGVNVSSPIFGTVIGSSVTLNSGGAVHVDQGSMCNQAGAVFNPGGTSPLPDPPRAQGCYVGTLNGWVQVQCQDPAVILPGFQHLNVAHNGVSSVPVSPASAVPFVYGQLETTVISVDALNQGRSDLNEWSVQNNTNGFSCTDTSQGVCLIQFATIQNGQTGNGAVCITKVHNIDTSPAYTNVCVGTAGQNVTIDNTFQFSVSSRKGPLQPFDFANIAGYTFSQNGQAMVGTVIQYSWVDGQDVVPVTQTDLPNRLPGLYAVVTTDSGLAGKWTSVTGSLIGVFNGATANFTNGELLTRIAASSCPGDVSAGGPTCPGQPVLSTANVQFTDAPSPHTGESNNLTLFSPTSILTFPNANLVVTDILASTNLPSGSAPASCVSSVPNHLFVRDNEGDNGGVPSNVGDVPFWESPDIFVVPQGAAAPGVNDTPADVEVTAGQPYNVYLRVHNDFGCTPITGPVSVFIDGADPNLGFQNWSAITAGSGSGQYTTFGAAGATIVPAFGTAILGPFPWTPPGSGHKCILAAVAAGGETAPPVTIQPGQSVLPPAYSSNQIAQRNLQIGDSCSYSLSNTTTSNANLLLGLSVSPATPAPGASGGPTVVLTFSDPSQAFFNAWQSRPGISVARSGSNTMVTLQASYIALPAVPLTAGQSPGVSISIQSSSQSHPTVNVSAILANPTTGSIIQANGGSCQSSGGVINPPG